MINRRDFLKVAGCVVPSWALLQPVAKAQSPDSGKFLVDVHCDGGIDASSWFDPRETDGTLNFYARQGVPAITAGNLRVAPMGNNGPFAMAHFSRIRVINGVNSETNSHEDGTRCHATGTLAMAYASAPEIYAFAKGSTKPLPWLNSGAFSMSAGLVPATAMPDGNSFRQLISPNANSATQDYMKQADIQKVLAARAERLKAEQAAGNLVPRAQLISGQFTAASDSRAQLAQVAQFLPATFDNPAHVGLVAAQSGLTCAISLATGGFDAHSQIVNSYAQSLPRLTTLLDYLFTKAAQLGIVDRMVVRVYSEFSRTPINSGDGKDHYQNGTQIFMENNAPWGNSVFGASGPRHEILKIDPKTGLPDPVNGKVMAPRHIHMALRKYMGFMTTDPRFQLNVPASEEFDIFNPNAKGIYPTM